LRLSSGVLEIYAESLTRYVEVDENPTLIDPRTLRLGRKLVVPTAELLSLLGL